MLSIEETVNLIEYMVRLELQYIFVFLLKI